MLQDPYQRRFRYVRLSLTEACNFRCSYCLPQGYLGKRPAMGWLTADEIQRAVEALAGLGVSKVRLTGGEPALRPDLVEVVRRIRKVPGIETVALTTNGYRLAEQAGALREAGLDQVNVSVDSLDADNFQRITGQRRLAQVLEGLEVAQAVGIQVLKVNAVYLKGLNAHEFADFVQLARRQPLSVRFIELMPTADRPEYFVAHHQPLAAAEAMLLEWGFSKRSAAADAGPAQVFAHPEFRGTVGLIRPYAKGFCESCNRLRMTASGGLRLCLFGKGQVDLRPLMQGPEQRQALQRAVVDALAGKAAGHALDQQRVGDNRSFSAMGG